MRRIFRNVTLDGFGNERFAHIVNALFHVAALEHLASLLINEIALLVHNVVVLKYAFADFVVSAFHALLRIFNLLGKNTVFDFVALAQAQLLNHRLNAVGAKQAHQIVLQGNEELAGAGIALTTRAAS